MQAVLTLMVGGDVAYRHARCAFYARCARLTVMKEPPMHDPLDGSLTPPSNRHDAAVMPLTAAARRILVAVAVALGLVILAPLALSSRDLYDWAAAPTGLNLNDYDPIGWWPALPPVALDLAAAACIGMTIISAWRRERPGIFGLLVWVFALTSAYAQYNHGDAQKDAGLAQDAWWAMPAFAVLGPLLLEVTLHKLRRWARQEAGEQHTGAAGFGIRWLPGVAFRETLSAWAASRREGIAKADDAIQFVRDRTRLKDADPVEALHYAFGALGVVDPHTARVWLAARGIVVDQAAIDTATAGLPVAPVSAPPDDDRQGAGWTDKDTHAARLAAYPVTRDKIRYAYSVLKKYDPAEARAWLAEHGVTVSRQEAHQVARQANKTD
jgi:hypothetical protein